jgi:hypothetical protein
MKVQSQLIIISSVIIAFMVAACEIKVMPPSKWGNQKHTNGDQVPLKANLSLNKIAVGVVKDGWETIDVTAIGERGESAEWTVKTSDETIARVSVAGNQIKVWGVNLGKTTLVISSISSSEKRTVPVYVYSPMELDVGDFTIRYVTNFKRRWNDRGSGGKHDASFWHPVMPDPSWHALGSLGFKGYYNPNGKHWMMIVKESKKGSGVLKKPVSYKKEYEDRDTRANLNGSFWTPICESGYVAMGTVVVDHWGRGNPERGELEGVNDVVCVRKDLTKPGKVAEFIWNDEKTEGTYSLSAWRITIPDIRYHDRAYLETGTFIGRGNIPIMDEIKKEIRNSKSPFEIMALLLQSKAECHKVPIEHPVLHVLAVDLPMLIDTPVELKIPQLTGYEQPALTIEPLMQKSMLVPFSALLEGNDFKYGDVGWLVKNSPILRVDRIVKDRLMFHSTNTTSLVQENHLELVSGVSKTDSTSMSHAVGVSVTHESGIEFKGVSAKTTFTASYQFGYETMHSVTEMQEKHTKVAINIPLGKAAACWQQRNKYRVIRHNEGELQVMAELDFGIDTYVVDEYPE